MHIYVIEQISTKRKYVGQTSRENALSRWHEHKTALISGNHWNRFLLRAWKKYGEPDFKFYIVHTCNSIETLNEYETYYINILRSMMPRYGFNLRSGGKTNTFSESSRKKLSLAAKQQWKRQDRKLIGEKISKATKEAMHSLSNEKKAKMIAHTQDDDFKKKLSETIKTKWQDADYRNKCLNKSHYKTPEFRKKQSERMKEYYRLKKINESK